MFMLMKLSVFNLVHASCVRHLQRICFPFFFHLFSSSTAEATCRLYGARGRCAPRVGLLSDAGACTGQDQGLGTLSSLGQKPQHFRQGTAKGERAPESWPCWLTLLLVHLRWGQDLLTVSSQGLIRGGVGDNVVLPPQQMGLVGKRRSRPLSATPNSISGR